MADVDVASNVSPYESAYEDATTTSQQVQFRVDGDPKAQQRPRMCHRKQGKPYLCNPDMRPKVAFRKKSSAICTQMAVMKPNFQFSSEEHQYI